MQLLLPDYQPSKMTVLGMWLPNLSPTYTLSIYVGKTPPTVTGSLKWSRPWKVPEREPTQWTAVYGLWTAGLR